MFKVQYRFKGSKLWLDGWGCFYTKKKALELKKYLEERDDRYFRVVKIKGKENKQ